MSKTYNILWIDDDHDDVAFEPFLIQAETKGILIDGFASFEEGFQELESRLNHYDVILLDALFFKDKTSETVNSVGLGNAIRKINELKSRKVFPYFVLSGQTNFTEETNPILEANEIKCYNKKSPQDVKQLLDDIIEAANNQLDTQIRHENHIIFEILKNYDTEVSKTILKILVGVKNGASNFDDELYFTQIRIILEHIFRKANDIGLLHDVCVQKSGNQVNLTEASLFLSGLDTKHLKVRCKNIHFPKIIAENVKNIIFITGAASHTSNVDINQNIDVQEYRKKLKTPYLLYSLTYQLIDILTWFEEYSQQNSDINANKKLWEGIEFDENNNKFETGEIVKIAMNGWATVNCERLNKNISVFKDTVIQLSLKEKSRIKFIIDEKLQAREIEII